MHRISRAPVLSATLRRDSCWIMANGPPPSLSRPFQDLDEAPALGAADRTALDHAHLVAYVGVVALVVRMQRRRGAHDLAVGAVPARDVHTHRDRLVGPVGDHDPLPDPGLALGLLDRRRRLGTGLR